MKTKTLLLLSLAGTTLAAACQKTVGPALEKASREITFGVAGDRNPDIFTKGATPVINGNLGTLYVSAITASGYAFQNIGFTPGGDGKWKGGKYWPVTNPGYSFAASNVSLVADSAQPSVQVNDAETDAVVAYLANPDFNAENTLTLQHIFAQVGTVTLKAPDGFTVTNLKLKLRPIIQGTYNLVTNTWTPGSALAYDVYIFGSAGSGVDLGEGGSHTSPDNDLWLVPGSYELTATYTISKDAFSNTKTATASVTFAQGYNNHIGLSSGASNIPSPGDIQELSFTVTVTDWDEQNVTASFTEQ